MYAVGIVTDYGKKSGNTELQIVLDSEKYEAFIKTKEVSRIGVWLDDGRMISAEQRKKIYASIKDFSSYTGYTPEESKEVLKYLYVERTGSPYFSLADCSMDTAGQFINLIIDVCLENGIILEDSLYERSENIDYMLQSCLKYRKCAICGRAGEMHHWDAIGMGNDRKRYDDSKNRKICLCRKHHTMAHQYGRERFTRIYHVYGIYYDENSEKDFYK
ncbi:MAG: putative HNHc nuclease [Bacillus sp. (in: Bacteria)]|nr:putative HNHc nuclease [Bacillus sp. (in: firmicutes)]MCM1427340.1 putative HNHc nuclease [Eubacterium sp.]